MCVELSGLREGMRCYAESFDAALVSAADASRVVDHASAIEKMAAAVKASAAARMAQTEIWKKEGDRSAAHHLARTTGSSLGQAQSQLETARRLEKLPDTCAAARRGELSRRAAAATSGATTEKPGAAAPGAGTPGPATRSEGEVRDKGDAGAGGVSPPGETKPAGPSDAGAAQPAPAGSDAGGGAIVSPGGAATVVPAPGASRPRVSETKVIVRVDFEALFRGHPIEGEVCEIVGFGPVAVSAVRDILDSGNAFLAAVISKGEQVLGPLLPFCHPDPKGFPHD